MWGQNCPHIFLRWLLLPTPKSHLPISYLLPGHWGSRSLGGGGEDKKLSLKGQEGPRAGVPPPCSEDTVAPTLPTLSPGQLHLICSYWGSLSLWVAEKGVNLGGAKSPT